MTTRSRFYPNLYKDSVSLMTVSAKVIGRAGHRRGIGGHGLGHQRRESRSGPGLGDFEVRPNDLVVAVSGTEEACDEALAKADELLSAKAAGGGDEAAGAPQPHHQHPDGGRQRSGAQLRARSRCPATTRRPRR